MEKDPELEGDFPLDNHEDDDLDDARIHFANNRKYTIHYGREKM
jgi:hypothetical protein